MMLFIQTYGNLVFHVMMVFVCMLIHPLSDVNAYFDIEIPSSFNPVGSGARAIGMGGAFIGLADDATSASWNPGGLKNIRKPEYSIVLSSCFRNENISSGKYPDFDGNHHINHQNLNFMGLTFPLQLNQLRMVFSLNYQSLYDFSREWDFTINQLVALDVQKHQWHYRQSGQLAATGFSYCIVFPPDLSIGITLNQWNNDVVKNRWTQEYHHTTTGTLGGAPLKIIEHRKIQNSFRGVNFNLGILWDINNDLSLGLVFKSPFKATVENRLEQYSEMISPMPDVDYKTPTRTNDLYMPLSMGIGFLYRFSAKWFMTFDLYRTNWHQFKYRDDKNMEYSPISEKLMSESNVEATHQIRLGTEYVWIDHLNSDSLTFRTGVFYDPAPSEKGIDDFYGISLGIGLTKLPWFSIDLAYQYRYGHNVGQSMLRHMAFSQDVHEHMMYSSIIYYLE